MAVTQTRPHCAKWKKIKMLLLRIRNSNSVSRAQYTEILMAYNRSSGRKNAMTASKTKDQSTSLVFWISVTIFSGAPLVTILSVAANVRWVHNWECKLTLIHGNHLCKSSPKKAALFMHVMTRYATWVHRRSRQNEWMDDYRKEKEGIKYENRGSGMDYKGEEYLSEKLSRMLCSYNWPNELFMLHHENAYGLHLLQ